MADDALACPNCGASAARPVASQVELAQANPPVAVASGPQVGPVPAQTEDKAVISLVLGILSLISLSILAGIPAIILGGMSKKNIRASGGRLTGEGIATVGIVMGWVSVALAVLFLLVFALMIGYVAANRH